MKMFKILVLFSFFFFSSSHGAVQDFCVGDLTLPQSPAGYLCKDPTKVTADDFVYTGLVHKGNTSTINHSNATVGTSNLFPGINGLNLIMGRLDLEVGGDIPLHTHPRASQMIVVIEGKILTGFISTTNVPYLKILNKYETMVFPQGTLHFQINAGNEPALAFVSLNGDNPGFQVTELSLFGSTFPIDDIVKTTFIPADVVKRLKELFGGSG